MHLKLSEKAGRTKIMEGSGGGERRAAIYVKKVCVRVSFFLRGYKQIGSALH